MSRGWSLYRWRAARPAGPGAGHPVPPTFAADDRDRPGSLQRRILPLQSALRITYTSPRTMH
jgi:hypothetical protein